MKIFPNKKLLKTVSWLILGFGFFVFIYQYFALGGTKIYINDFHKDSKTISDFYPEGRAKDKEMDLITGEKYQRISSEPVYFDVFLPNFFGKQIFDKVKISLTYQNSNQNILELGLRKNYQNLDTWSFDIKPLENKLIDQSEKNKLQENNLILLQKSDDFKTIDQFLKNPPLNKKIATYNYNLDYHYFLPNTPLSSKIYEINLPLLGSHTFIFYKGKERANFEIEIEKQTASTVPFELSVTNQKNKNIIHQVWNDGKSITGTNKKLFKISLKNQEKEGLYYLKINASENVLITHLKTSQKYFVIQNKINLGTLDHPIKLFSDAPEILFLPNNQNGFQKVKVNGETILVFNLLKKAIWPPKSIEKTKDKLHIIEIPKGNLTLTSDNFFVINEENYFNPLKNIFPIRYYHTQDDFDYLIAANYTPPYRSKRFYQSSTTFDLNGIVGRPTSLNFILSVPGLYKNKGDIIVYKIKAEFQRKPYLFSKIKKLFKK